MLIDVESGKVVDRIPYRSGLRHHPVAVHGGGVRWDGRTVQRADRRGGRRDRNRRLAPGSDRTGTPFQPIYTKAARGDFNRAAMFFGQLVWYAVMNRPEGWASGRYEVDGRDIGSRTYFRVRNET